MEAQVSLTVAFSSSAFFGLLFLIFLLTIPHRFSMAGVSNPAPGELPSFRFQLQPQSNTPEPANHGLQGYLFISDRCVGAGLELKSAGW